MDLHITFYDYIKLTNDIFRNFGLHESTKDILNDDDLDEIDIDLDVKLSRSGCETKIDLAVRSLGGRLVDDG